MTEEELLEIEKLCEAATAGPWRPFLEGRDHQSGSSFIRTGGDDIEMTGAKEADYDFIAGARQTVPRLLEEVRRLRAQRAGGSER